MSRKPIDQLAQSKKPQGRQAIWESLKGTPEGFSATSISHRTEINRKTIADYLIGLCAAGYITEKFERTEGGAPIYKLTRDVGQHCPRVTKTGKKVTQGQGNQNIWRAMRMLPSFSTTDLAVHATTSTVKVDEGTCKKYCSILLAAGYLRVVQKAQPAKGRKAVYRLISDTGPQPPQIQRVQALFDPNLGKVVYQAEPKS